MGIHDGRSVADVFGGLAIGIDDPLPGLKFFWDWREFKQNLVPVGVEDQVIPLVGCLDGKGDAALLFAPVWSVKLGAVPANSRTRNDLV